MSTATKDELGGLHRLVTQAYIGEIQTCMREEIPVTPAILSGAAKFLKDNEITADPADKKDLRNLQDTLKRQAAERDKVRANVLDFARQG